MWNVNPGGEPGKMTKKEELIETLWNVNLSTVTGTWYWTNRINRNIVECKYCYMQFWTCKAGELIETLWNVNGNSWPQVGQMQEELIETLWNVNEVTSKYSTVSSFELIETLWNVNALSF